MPQKKYIVTYNLKTVNWNYTNFYNTLQSCGDWWHYLDTTWVIKTSLTSSQIYEKIAPYLSKNDSVLVTEIVTGTFYGWLPLAAWQWLNAN